MLHIGYETVRSIHALNWCGSLSLTLQLTEPKRDSAQPNWHRDTFFREILHISFSRLVNDKSIATSSKIPTNTYEKRSNIADRVYTNTTERRKKLTEKKLHINFYHCLHLNLWKFMGSAHSVWVCVLFLVFGSFANEKLTQCWNQKFNFITNFTRSHA